MIEDSDEIKAQKEWMEAKKREDEVWDGTGKLTNLMAWRPLHEETERLLQRYLQFITPLSK